MEWGCQDIAYPGNYKKPIQKQVFQRLIQKKPVAQNRPDLLSAQDANLPISLPREEQKLTDRNFTKNETDPPGCKNSQEGQNLEVAKRKNPEKSLGRMQKQVRDSESTRKAGEQGKKQSRQTSSNRKGHRYEKRKAQKGTRKSRKNTIYNL